MPVDRPHSPTEYLRKPTPAPPAEQAAQLPDLNTAYKASGIVDSEISRLVVVMGKEGFQFGRFAYITLQYVHLGIGRLGFTPQGQVFNFVFSDIQPVLLTVHGRNLMRIYDYIGLRRMPWIRQKDRDFRAVGVESDEPVITLAQVQDWKRPAGEQDAALEEAMQREEEMA